MDSLCYMFGPENNGIYTCPSSSSSEHSGSLISDGGYKLASSNPKKRTGRRKFKETRHPVYRGIRRRNGDKWVCELRKNNKSRLWLGTYPSAEMAARAHDVAALALRGKSACLNFADSVWRLPVPASSTDTDIRVAAMEAAQAFRPRESSGGEESEGWERDCSDAESSSSTSSSKVDGSEENLKDVDEQSGVPYMDEEAILFMPQLLVDLADGLLLPPPTIFYDETTNLSSDYDLEIALWNY